MIKEKVQARANGVCELCSSDSELCVYEVPYSPTQGVDEHILTCGTCHSQLTGTQTPDDKHWRCLSDAMWSPVPAVQVVAYRMLKHFEAETWAQDLLAMLYLDDDLIQWAEAKLVAEDKVPTVDVNGTVLAMGDTVHLVKDLNVKGAGFTAKRGTVVRNIGLSDNPEHIEGKVNGTRIVIIAAYTKKA